MKGSIWVLCDPRYKYNLFWSPYSTHNDIWCLEGISSINTISHWYIFPFSWAKVISSAFQVGSLSVLTLLFFASYISDKSKFIQLRTQQGATLWQQQSGHDFFNISSTTTSQTFHPFPISSWNIHVYPEKSLYSLKTC